MFVYDFSFHSLTAAHSGRSVLQYAGISSQLARAPKCISVQGCGYVLQVAQEDGPAAAQILQVQSVAFRRIFRHYDTGRMEEAGYDLF